MDSLNYPWACPRIISSLFKRERLHCVLAALSRIIASQSKDSSPANRRPNTSQSHKGFLHRRNLFVLHCPVIKKTPRIAAWCHSAFLFNVSCSSNFDGIFRIRGLPRGRFQPTTSLAGFVSYHHEVLTFKAFRDKFLILRCTAERSSYPPRQAPRY